MMMLLLVMVLRNFINDDVEYLFQRNDTDILLLFLDVMKRQYCLFWDSQHFNNTLRIIWIALMLIHIIVSMISPHLEEGRVFIETE